MSRQSGSGPRRHAFEAFASVALAIGARGLYLLTQVVIARSLGPEGFGLYALGWTVAGLGITFAGLGVQQCVIRFRVAGGHLWSLGLMPAALAASSAVAAGVILNADWIAGVLFRAPEAASPIALLAPSIPMTVVLAIQSASMKVLGRPLLGIGFSSLGITLGPSLAVLAVWLGGWRSPGSFALASSLGLVPGLFVAAALMIGKAVEPEATGLLARAVYALQSLGVHACSVLNMWVDRLAVAALSTVAQLGLYQAASQLSMVPMMLATTITALNEADLARASSREERTVVFVRTQLMQIHVVGAGCLAGIITAPTWLGLLFGAEFSAGGPALAALLLAQLLRAVGGPVVGTLSLGGHVRAALWLSGVALALGFGLSLVLVGAFGALGAAAASLVASLVVVVVGLRLCLAGGLVAFRLSPLLGPLISAGCLLAVAVPLSLAAPESALADIGIVAASFLAWFAPMVALRVYAEEDEIAAALRRLRPWRSSVVASRGFR